jgi:ankyrin repeat protein
MDKEKCINMNKLHKIFLYFLVCVNNNSRGMLQCSDSYVTSTPLHRRVSKLISSPMQNDVEAYWSKRLEEAVRNNKHKLIKEAFYYVPGLYVPGLAHKPCGEAALHVAVILSRYGSVKLLYEYGMSLNAQGTNGDAPLHSAKNAKMAHLLVGYGADINQKNDAGETPFFTTIKNSRLAVARVYVKAGANVNEGDNNKDTPLHYAVNNLGPEEVKFLLYHGADANQPNNKWLTVYDIIRKWHINDHTERKRKEDIVGAFQDFKKVFDEIAYPSVDDTHFTVMSLLACNGKKLKEILMLDAAGYCSPEIISAEKVLKTCDIVVWEELTSELSPYSKEVLRLAKLIAQRSCFRQQFLNCLQDNNFFMAKSLVQANPYILYTYQDEYECDEASTLLAEKFFAIPAGTSDYRHVKELLLEGFNIDAYDDQGKSLLCLLIMDPTDKVKYKDLLKAGVKVNTIDNSGKTPLSYAVALGDEDKVRALLRHGAVVRSDMIKEEILPGIRSLCDEAFNAQKCCACGWHQDNMSALPCIKRHVAHINGYGYMRQFICENCYLERDHCPLCKRLLDEYGW